MKNHVAFFMIAFMFLAPTTEARRVLNASNCLTDFKVRTMNASYIELTRLARTLTKRDLKCLYHEASKNGPPSWEFFAPQGGENDVALLFGKNSMPFLNTFEKHIFSSRSMVRAANDPTKDLFGINVHGGMRITGPGFFKIKSDDAAMLIDFTDDFISEIDPEDLAMVSTVNVTSRNNHGNIFFGGDTKDYCVRLLYDEINQRDIAVVCEGYRTFFGHRHAFIWDILIRQWD